MQITDIVTNVGILAAVAIIASEYLSKLTKLQGFFAQAQSWVVAVFVSYFAGVLGLIPESGLLSTVIYGLVVGLVSNGLFEIPVTKAVLEMIRARLPKVVA